MTTRDARWMIGVLAVTLGVMVWASPSVGAYINFTGENFVYPTTGNAGSGCAGGALVAHCYASFPDGSITGATLRAIVPQDMPTASTPPRLKCNVHGYTPDGGAGTAIMSYTLHAYPTGAEPLPTAGGTTSLGFAATTTGNNLIVKTAYDTFITMYDQAANANCGNNATCVGVPFELSILRGGNDGSDTLAGAFRVIGVVCEY